MRWNATDILDRTGQVAEIFLFADTHRLIERNDNAPSRLSTLFWLASATATPPMPSAV